MKIVVRSPNWLGDCVMAFWAIWDVVRDHPNMEVSFMARRSVAQLHSLLPFAKEIIPLESDKGLRGLMRNRKRLLKINGKEYQYGILLPNSLASALEMKLLSPNICAGYNRDMRAPFLDIKLSIPPWEKKHHIYHYYRNIFENVLLSKEVDPTENAPGNTQIHLTFDEKDKIGLGEQFEKSKMQERYVAIGAGAAFGPAKQWDIDSYIELSDIIAKRLECDVVLLGADSDSPYCEQIAKRSTARAFNLCGKTSLPQVALALKNSVGFIGNDSGLMHLAALVGVPTTGLFFSTDTVRTPPIGKYTSVVAADIECRPCHNRTCNVGYKCRSKITPIGAFESFFELVSSRAKVTDKSREVPERNWIV